MRVSVQNSALLFREPLNGLCGIAKLLIKNGEDINILNNAGKSLLYHESYYRINYDLIKLLLKSGIDIDIINNHKEEIISNQKKLMR